MVTAALVTSTVPPPPAKMPNALLPVVVTAPAASTVAATVDCAWMPGMSVVCTVPAAVVVTFEVPPELLT